MAWKASCDLVNEVQLVMSTNLILRLLEAGINGAHYLQVNCIRNLFFFISLVTLYALNREVFYFQATVTTSIHVLPFLKLFDLKFVSNKSHPVVAVCWPSSLSINMYVYGLLVLHRTSKNCFNIYGFFVICKNQL